MQSRHDQRGEFAPPANQNHYVARSGIPRFTLGKRKGLLFARPLLDLVRDLVGEQTVMPRQPVLLVVVTAIGARVVNRLPHGN